MPFPGDIEDSVRWGKMVSTSIDKSSRVSPEMCPENRNIGFVWTSQAYFNALHYTLNFNVVMCGLVLLYAAYH